MKRVQRLNSDRLGKKGEARFAELAYEAGLTCNPSTDDRTGWDFLVEFPFPHVTPQVTLDRRPHPPMARIQTKTRWASSPRVKLPLASAERLAKSLDPAFLVIFDVDDDLKIVEGRLIHVSGETLARILKRLRSEVQKRTARLAEKSLVIDPADWGESFHLTGAGLEAALRSAMGDDLASYADSKRRQLETLGYGEERLSGKVTLKARDKSHLVDAFLGLQPVDVTDFALLETRFGIALPATDIPSDFTGATLTILPEPTPCEIIIRKGLADPVIRLPATFVAPPRGLVSDEAFKVVVRSRFFEITLRAGALDWRTIPEAFSDEVATFRELWSAAKALAYMTTTGGEVAFTMGGQKSPFSVPLVAQPSSEQTATFQYYGRLFDRTRRVFEALDWSDRKLHFADIHASARDISFLDALLHAPETLSNLSFTLNTESEWRTPAETVLFIHVSHVTGQPVGLVAEADMDIVASGTSSEWRSRNLRPVTTRPLVDLEDDYRHFVEDAKQAAKPAQVLIIGSLNGDHLALSAPA